MSELIKKSESSFNASKLLLENKLYNSSVHCSYYSSIQLMLHILREYFKKDDQGVDEITKKSNNQSAGGFHNNLFNWYLKEIRKKNQPNEKIQKFNNFFLSIKRNRVSADYKNEIIQESKAKETIVKSEEINKYLKTIFI